MTTTTRYTYRTEAEKILARAAMARDVKHECSPFQRERLEILLSQGQQVYASECRGGACVVFVSKDGVSQMLMPDGSLAMPVKGTGKFSFNWLRVQQMLSAPAAPGLVKARAQLAA